MDEIPHPTPGYDQGRSHIWTAETIRAIHAKAELGRYQIRGFSTFQKLPTLDDLVFLPGVMTRLPLEGYREHCETKTLIGGGRPELVSEPLELAFPVYLTSMSFGALGTNAKRALGMGFSRAGLATCTGEGGMLPEEREASDKLIYQMTPSRYGLDLEHLRMADAIEIVVGQGAKPGTGGMLLGMKVSEKVAEMRTLPVGVDQRSAARHPDFLGGDDLAVKIEELREATDYRVPIILKLAACRVEQDVKIAAKTGCDAIVIDGTEGSTAASPEFQLDHTGVPTLTAIPAARRALEDIGMYGKVTLIASGGIRSGVDAAKALALGADCVAIGTAALMAAGCNSPVSVGGVDATEGYAALGTSAGACHHCHTGRCPVGVTTQDPELEARLDPELGAERGAQLPHVHVLRDDDPRQVVRQGQRPQPRARGPARALARGLGLHGRAARRRRLGRRARHLRRLTHLPTSATLKSSPRYDEHKAAARPGAGPHRRERHRHRRGRVRRYAGASARQAHPRHVLPRAHGREGLRAGRRVVLLELALRAARAPALQPGRGHRRHDRRARPRDAATDAVARARSAVHGGLRQRARPRADRDGSAPPAAAPGRALPGARLRAGARDRDRVLPDRRRGPASRSTTASSATRCRRAPRSSTSWATSGA